MAKYYGFQLRIDSTLNWYASNPRLALGEPGIDINLMRFKVGNGIDRWNELPYMNADIYSLFDKEHQDVADKIQDIHNKIDNNQLTLSQGLANLRKEFQTLDTDLKARMTNAETRQANYEAELTQRQEDYEENLTGEFEETKAEVSAGLEEFNETRDALNFRMDVIVGNATEDTEILDARIDANNQVHPNLGHNIRSVHGEVLALNEDLAEDAANLEAEAQTRQAEDERQEEEISEVRDGVKKNAAGIDDLRERSDDNADGILSTALLLNSEIEQRRKIESDLISEADERKTKDYELESALNAEANTREIQDNALESALNVEISERQENYSELGGDLSNAKNVQQTNDDFLRDEINTLAEAVLKGQLTFAQAIERLKEKISEQSENFSEALTRENEERTASDEELKEAITDAHEQSREISAGLESEKSQREAADEIFSREAENLSEKDKELQQGLTGTREKISSGIDFLLEGINDTAGIALENTLKIRGLQTDFANEQQTRQAETLELSAEVRELRNNTSHNDNQHNTELSQLQEDTAALGAGLMAESLNRYKDAIKLRNLEEIVKNIHFPIDWSNEDFLQIPEPRCAIVNFSGLISMPTSKTVEIPAYLEFWDLQGNYFKKNILCSAQGSSSLGYVKKNVKFDLLNQDGSEFDFKIGNWVVQDGFHLKAYYTDFFRGVGVTSYKLWDEIINFDDALLPYEKELLNIPEMNTTANGTGNISDLSLQFDTGALCHPDGFPCIVYLNGEFYGVFSWQLKKNRKNYHMEKSTVEHIHLDGSLYTGNFWNGNINWTTFEIRNPNKLYTMDGKKYDGDAPRELIDETSEKYDASDKNHVRSAQVKKYIQDFVTNFGVLKQLYTAYQANPTDETLAAVKAKYEELFDWENQRDYLIFSDVIKNSDGFGKNWQWTTYDGVKWYVNAYDLDMSFGGHWQGTQITPPLTGHITTSKALPTYYVALLYETELKQRYSELRDAGIIDTAHIAAFLEDWTARIGAGNYELEFEKWPNSPCVKNYRDSVFRVKKWLDVEISNMDRLYNYTPREVLKDAEIFSQVSAMIAEQDAKKTAEISGQALLRSEYDAGLQEQINELTDLTLQKILDDTADKTHAKKIFREELIRIHNEINDLAGANLLAMVNDYNGRTKLNAKLNFIKTALIGDDDDFNAMIDDIFSGNSEVDTTLEDDDEFSQMLDEVFNS